MSQTDQPSFREKYLKRDVILRYLYDQLTGNFMGFFVGMSASGLVSHFFETRSIRNLWGLSSKKTVIDKETFENLEWIIAIVIGFIVFEIMTKVVKERLHRHFPMLKRKVLRFMVGRRLHSSTRQHYQNGVQFISAMNVGMRHAFNRFSRR